MKTRTDPRHRKRALAVQELFAYEFNSDQAVGELTSKITLSLDKIDLLVKQAAPQRPVAQINKLDLAILRLAIYELTVAKDAPYKVIVDEAVELAKEYGAESSPQFINGALGHLIETEHLSSWHSQLIKR